MVGSMDTRRRGDCTVGEALAAAYGHQWGGWCSRIDASSRLDRGYEMRNENSTRFLPCLEAPSRGHQAARTRSMNQNGLSYLSKWLRAATTVSFAKLYETETLANQFTTAPRMSRKSVWRETGQSNVEGRNGA